MQGDRAPTVSPVRRHAKSLAMLAYAGAFLPTIGDRIATIDQSSALIAYTGLLAIACAGLAAICFVRSAILRWGLAALIATSEYFCRIYEMSTTQFLTYDAFINLLYSAAFAGDAMQQNKAAFVGAAPFAILALLAIGLPPRRRLPGQPFVPFVISMAAFALICAVLFLRAGDGARGLPKPYPPIAYLALSAYEAVTIDYGPRQSVTIPHRRPSERTIVLIVDESISARYLDINDPAGVATPLSRPWPGLTIQNFGVAASITTCSVGTNLTLRHGGTRGDYQRINATMPSIFAYAKAAGLRTIYIDAQRTGGALQNRMSQRERAAIDDFVQFDRVAIKQRDMAVADELIRRIANGPATFILVNKVGAHFPVHDKYPDDFMRYRPALPRGNYTDISDTGDRNGFGGSPEDWRRYRNSYRNTVAWNVGAFFDRLLGSADLSKTSIIYTSDHGQDLHEQGQPGLHTHCSSFPQPSEGEVPLVLIQSDVAHEAEPILPAGRASHYAIFPTMLSLMGYDERAIRKTYGPGLNDATNDPGTFNAMFNARFGRKPVWMAVKPAGKAD